jgi:uncharacterized protein (DUF302 family)
MRFVTGLLLAVLLAGPAWGAGVPGLIKKESPYSAQRTLDRLGEAVRAEGLTVFARISHSEGAAGVGMDLRPTELLIFGNPEVGTHFFTSRQTAGLDLPMKALAWTDAEGRVWLAYNDPAYIAERHGIGDRSAVVKKMTRALDALTDRAVGR